jgi:glycosyltransferase involved in cell wall biosynthesis
MNEDVAVLIPCYNEADTIARVVTSFREALPGARVYVYDNNSDDDTAHEAVRAGAIVRREPLQGKGQVVRRMFADVEAAIYVMADGDDTYDANEAPMLIRRLIDDHLDMVVGSRARTPEAYRAGHRLGNSLLTGAVSLLFGDRFTDMLSGYRVFSRRFVKTYPAVLSSGFEIETEITVHALEMRVPVAEVPIRYAARPVGSESKLRTIRDGVRIFITILLLLKAVRPFFLFGLTCLVLAGTSVATATPVLETYLETGLVPRLPTAVLSTGMMLLAFLSLVCGLILDSVSRGRREMKRLFYLGAEASCHEDIRSA